MENLFNVRLTIFIRMAAAVLQCVGDDHGDKSHNCKPQEEFHESLLSVYSLALNVERPLNGALTMGKNLFSRLKAAPEFRREAARRDFFYFPAIERCGWQKPAQYPLQFC